MGVLHQVHEFLGAERRDRLRQLLTSPALEWRRADQLGRTTSGQVWQLATRDMHDRPEMVQLANVMASLVYNEIAGAARLPEPECVTPQVFPVRMAGDPDDPPLQTPHRDHAGDRVPAITTLYYLQVDDTLGGDLVLYDDVDGSCDRVTPTTDLLVVIPGQQLHAVDPLVRGYRVTIVTNFYLNR